MATLTEQDRNLIAAYRSAGVLDDLDSHKLDPQDGLIFLMCGDPDQHPEAYSHAIREITKAGYPSRIHAPSPLGGALRLAPDSPVNEATPGYDLCLLYDLNLVREKKGINTYALCVHAPCAVAALAGMSFADIIRYAFAAKLRIKQTMPEAKVAVFCHIDRGDGDKKTYFVCRARWEQYHRDAQNAGRESAGPAMWAPRLQEMYPNRVKIVSASEAMQR
jgi:hypothetical protein